MAGKNDGDWAIWGKDDCHIYPDGDGHLLYFSVGGADEHPDCTWVDREPSSLPSAGRIGPFGSAPRLWEGCAASFWSDREAELVTCGPVNQRTNEVSGPTSSSARVTRINFSVLNSL
jgi:hypothetical protein